MFNKTIIGVVALLCVASVNAQSSDLYGEVGYTQIKYTELGYEAKPTMLRGIVGKNINENFAFEGMLATGISDGSARISGVNVALKVDNAWGFFFKAKAKATQDLEIYGRLGMSKINATISARGYSLSDSGSDTSIGVGAKLKMTKDTSLFVDQMTYYQKNGAKATGITAGIGFSF